MLQAELKDHKIIRQRRAVNGTQLLYAPMAPDALLRLQQELIVLGVK